ncbi:hypothetical protein [Sphingomonas rubra]|uniref:Uncharacterized protein n=1 Tax=Sphingomonas rubra TaxID=634430 RepID=A0A1I5QHH1_9SPHN|nr:hypothetical protein [Sphingomonas rubra]SFP45490.1 hypothetical protein SAMN04488241_10235 [Sphingomonas rubra]
MLLPPAERTRLILAASDAYGPDLLVTAGYAVHNRKQLHRLAGEIADDERDGLIITEVHWDGRTQRRSGRSHAMWAISGRGDLHRFGRQAFSTMEEATAADGKARARFRRHLPNRNIAVGPYSAFALVCGELNLVRGRDTLSFVDDEAGAALMAADIIVNPTHDRMSNAGTLAAKRRFLSQPHANGRSRAYVSCSNWEACGLNGRVQHPSPTLHAVYVDGEPLAYEELADGAFGFVYRRWWLDLAGSG